MVGITEAGAGAPDPHISGNRWTWNNMLAWIGILNMLLSSTRGGTVSVIGIEAAKRILNHANHISLLHGSGALSHVMAMTSSICAPL